MSRNTDGSFNAAVEEAKRRAMARGAESTAGGEWPDASEVTLEAALQQFTLEMYASGAKLSVGVLVDGTGIFCRVSYPKWCEAPQAGQTALTVGNTLEKALRKASLLGATLSDKVWKPDQFAK